MEQQPVRPGLAAFPNPVSDRLSLEIELVREGVVNLFLYDVHLNLVSKVLDGAFLSEGKHGFQVDFSNVGVGIYFVELVVNGNVCLEKVMKQ